MHSFNSKFTLYALFVAAGALASNQYPNLSPPFPDCAVVAVTSAVFYTACHDETLSCICTDHFFIDAFPSSAFDYCDDSADAIKAIKIIESQCSKAGFPLPTSTVIASPTGGGWRPPHSSDCSDFSSWSGSYPPYPTESWTTTTTAPCASETEAPTTSGVITPTTGIASATTTSPGNASATTTLPVTNGGKGRGEKVAGMVELVVAALGVLVMV